MTASRWGFHWFWRYWSFAWGSPWGATGWTPTLRTWQVGPLRVTRYYSPVKLDD